MAIQPIALFPDAVLSTPCQSLKHFDDSLRQLATDLIDTLRASPGVGLAAPQIGVPKRVAVIDVSLSRRKMKGTHHGLLVIVNPRIASSNGEQLPREGCLSVPDWLGTVRRSMAVTVDFHDLNGLQQSIHADGFEALALQHEVDHLNGRLFLDRIANIKTDLFRRTAPQSLPESKQVRRLDGHQ